MNFPDSPRLRALCVIAFAGFMGLGGINSTYADRGPDRGRDHDRFERRAHERYVPYRSDHWVLDTRFRHNHYYPRPGYFVSVLPPGYLDIGFRGRRFFFSAGVWFRQEGPRYVVVAPPPGLLISTLPPAYTTVWIGSVPYYYANGVYYAPARDGGYAVVEPPPGYEEAVVETPPPGPGAMAASPPPPPAPMSVPPSDSLFVYPRNGQSEAQTARDRADCARWATAQTGLDPLAAGQGDLRQADYQRAMGACLEGRGYTVR